jgi:hypothetical protein
MQQIMFHGLPNFASIPPQKGKSTTKPGDRGTSKSQNTQFSIIYYVEGPHMSRMGMNALENPVTHVFILYLKAHDHTNFIFKFP